MSKYVFFWRNKSPFSNWYPSKFNWNGIEFTRGEQYMMYRKALLFNDLEIAEKIMNTDDPKEQKDLGRKVKNYNDEKWSELRFDIMVHGLYCKFKQNEKLKTILLETAGKCLVEANPYDKIWGIGLEESDSRAQDESQWLGQNLLGKVLNTVRDKIIQEETKE